MIAWHGIASLLFAHCQCVRQSACNQSLHHNAPPSGCQLSSHNHQTLNRPGVPKVTQGHSMFDLFAQLTALTSLHDATGDPFAYHSSSTRHSNIVHLATVSIVFLQATVCAKFGLQCIVYMGAKDMERQKLNVFRMRLLGAEVRPVTSGTATLKDATSEAIRDWVTNVETTHYILGSAAGPHPYPMMVKTCSTLCTLHLHCVNP